MEEGEKLEIEEIEFDEELFQKNLTENDFVFEDGKDGRGESECK